MYVEAVAESDGVPGFEPPGYAFVVDARLARVGREYHDYVGPLRGLVHGKNFETGFLGLFPAPAPFPQPHSHVHAAVPKVLGVRVPLAPVSDNSDFSLLQLFQVNVAVVVNLHFSSPLFFVSFDSRFMATVPVLANSFIPMGCRSSIKAVILSLSPVSSSV